MATIVVLAACGGTGGGSGAGGGSGGTGGSGGGSTSTGGIATFAEVGFDYPQLATDSSGTAHLVHARGVGDVVYRSCASGCAEPAAWGDTVIEASGGSILDLGLLVAPDKRLHVLMSVLTTGAGTQIVYGTCASGCANASNWQKLNLTTLTNGDSFGYRSHNFVIDSTGRLYFGTSDLTINAKLRLFTCASNCADLASWSGGQFRQGGLRVQMVAIGTTLHQVMHNDLASLIYRTCSSNCTAAASWTESGPIFAQGSGPDVNLTTTSDGKLLLAYNQGIAGSNESATVKAQDLKLLVWECGADCAQPTSWKGVILGNVKDGLDGLSLVTTSLGRAVVMESDDLKLLVRTCETNCLDAASWQAAELDSTAAVNATFDPYTALMCSNGRPNFASWYPNAPDIAVSPQGAAFIAHAPNGLRMCAGATMSSRQPSIGRVIYAPQ